MTITHAAIEAAAARLAPYIRLTPVLQAMVPGVGSVAFKLEQLQLSGSFKARGAFNGLLSQPVPAAGVVAASGGNHGAAVALAAQTLGHKAAIFVPTFAPAAKVERIRGYGAEVVQVGDHFGATRDACLARETATGARNIHAYDQPATLAGQGTVAKEFLAQAPGLDTILIAVGGGGLIGGITAWCQAVGGPKVVAVEPETAASFNRAMTTGAPVEVTVSGVAADSLGAPRLGELSFAIATAAKTPSVLVEDSAIKEAQRYLWRELRIAVEPGGATALAALLSGRYRPAPGERIGVLLCGANCDPATLS